MMGAFIQVNLSSIRAQVQPVGYVVQENGCWEWVGCRNKAGYGLLGVKNQEGKCISTLASRYLWEQERGPIPLGLEIDHLCRNPPCVRVDHLEPVTHKENLHRGDHSKNSIRARTKTYCHRGHKLSGENLYVNSLGYRYCRTCKRTLQRIRRQKVAICL